jgi:hypothetical protein
VILYTLLLIVSVVGSILGCFGACCGNRVCWLTVFVCIIMFRVEGPTLLE